MDDGMIAVRPHRTGHFLATFDGELDAVGGSRVANGVFKSTAYLAGSPEAITAADPSWVHAAMPSCKILTGPPRKVLGIGISGESLRDQFHAATQTLQDTCSALQGLDDAAVELALLRISTNVCRVAHFLRAAGPDVPLADLDSVDEIIAQTLSFTLGGQCVALPWLAPL